MRLWRTRIRGVLKRILLRAGRRIPAVRAMVADAQAARDAFRFVPAGHYFSPIPSREQIRADAERLAAARPRELPGIALNEERQLAVLERLKVFYRELPFPKRKIPERRYFFENSTYSYSDAICLYGMIRHVQPRRIIEVGSGYSSCVTLDTNELFFANRIACTFIEPFPALLRSLIMPDDPARVEIIASPLQDLDVARFRELN
jgi:hypothetical protein